MAPAPAKRPFLLLPWRVVFGLLVAAVAVTQFTENSLGRREAAIKQEREMREANEAARRRNLPAGRPLVRTPDTIEGRLYKVIATAVGERIAARVTINSYLFVSRSFFYTPKEEEADYDIGLPESDQYSLWSAIEDEFGGEVPEEDRPAFNCVKNIIAVAERLAAELEEKKKTHRRCTECGTWVKKSSATCPICDLIKTDNDR